MSSLYRKYRPATFSQVVGQTHIVKTLSNAIKNRRIGHAYLFTGPRGTGKTSLARIFAKAVNCLNLMKLVCEKQSAMSLANEIEPCNECANCRLIQDNRAIDLLEIDAASHTGVDNIRQLKETVVLPPTTLKYKIYIIDEAHMLSIGAFNALLKTLEEPPEHAIFILATTELHKIPETILSRCQRFDFSRFTQDQIISRLKQLCESEKVKIEDEALETIALEAEGGMRDAESILGQIISLEDKEITSEEVNQILGTSSKRLAADFIGLLIENKITEALERIETIQTEGVDLKNFNKNILSFLRNLLILKTSPTSSHLVPTLTQEQLKSSQAMVEKASLSQLLLLVDLFQKSLQGYKNSSIPQLPLELAVIEYHVTKNTPPTFANTTGPQSPVNPVSPAAPPIKTAPANQPIESTNKAPDEPIINQPDNQPNNPPAAQSTGQADLLRANLSLELMLDKWSDILEGVKPYNHSIHAFLKNCVPCGFIGNQLYIKTKYDFYKEKLNEPQNRLTVQNVIAKIIEGNLKIAYATEQECQKLKFDQGQTESGGHNILHDAMQMLGGRIVNE